MSGPNLPFLNHGDSETFMEYKICFPLKSLRLINKVCLQTFRSERAKQFIIHLRYNIPIELDTGFINKSTDILTS